MLYLENREGALVSKDKDSIPYTAQVWFEGRECDTKSETRHFEKCADAGGDPREICSFLWKKTTRQGILKKNISGTIRKCGRSDVLSGKKECQALLEKDYLKSVEWFLERRKGGFNAG